MLIGNKTDLVDKRAVASETASDFASKNQIAYLETSAFDGSNVDLAFQSLINEIYNLYKANGAFTQDKTFAF